MFLDPVVPRRSTVSAWPHPTPSAFVAPLPPRPHFATLSSLPSTIPKCPPLSSRPGLHYFPFVTRPPPVPLHTTRRLRFPVSASEPAPDPESSSALSESEQHSSSPTPQSTSHSPNLKHAAYPVPNATTPNESDDAQQRNKPPPPSQNLSQSQAQSPSHVQLQHGSKPLRTKKLALPGVIFLIVTYIWSIVLIIPMLIAHPFVLFFDRTSRRFHDVIAMAWMRRSLWTVRVRPRVVNEYNIPVSTPNVVYVANHTSYLDIFVFAYLFRRIKYVSKAEIFRIPIVGWAMQMAGNIALVRASTRGQLEAYRKMVRTLESGVSLVVFPEGTRSETGVMRRFKRGAFRAAKQQEALVVPITILGTREIMPSSAYVPLEYPKNPIQLVVHPPIDSSSRSIEQIMDAAFRSIDSALPPHVRTYPASSPTAQPGEHTDVDANADTDYRDTV